MIYMLLIPLLLGWLSGWLVNYLADVLPTNRKFVHPVCHACQKEITWAGYLFFRRCSNCGKRRTIRAFIVQFVMTIAPILIWIFPRQALPFPLAYVLLIYLAIVLLIDLEHRLILHPVSIAGAILGLGTGIYLRSGASISRGILSTLLGGAAGFVIMLVFYFAGELFVKRMAKRGSMPKDEVALGFGDVNLSGILGLMLGWPFIFYSLFFAIMAGGLVSLVIIIGMLLIRKYKAFTAIPYAPFLIISAIYFLFR
jgi:prepilin signal peptidase PulO-like enzyme (type II secretory pathway)